MILNNIMDACNDPDAMEAKTQMLIAAFLQNFADLPVVRNAFAGIRVCVCVLIIQAVLRLWKKSVPDLTALILYLIIFALMACSSVLPVSVPAAVLVICAGVFGVIWKSLHERKEEHTS